jgi:hypothetical protein
MLTVFTEPLPRNALSKSVTMLLKLNLGTPVSQSVLNSIEADGYGLQGKMNESNDKGEHLFLH